MEGETTPELSKYNEAMLQIHRLHECWTRCNTYIRSGNLTAWRWELDIIWLELVADVDRLTKEEAKNTLTENDDLKKATRNSAGVNLYESIYKRHQFLKKLQDSVGKGGVFDDGTSEDID